ncbi:ATP-grasp domain-containing protein [Planctomicrobium sp. SH664]|uniref:ATP-grasp domain-containing protein n=1 Tax=Planctomicrobium sp. SH664 TaxID=3448125 RepID=UPI003F5C6FC8
MNIGVLGNAGSWYVSELEQAGAARGHSVVIADFCRLASSVVSRRTEVVSADVELNPLHALLVRTMPPGSLEQVIYRMDVLQRLAAQGVRVLNSPKAIECAVDKFLTTSRLAAAGLPTPRTVVCESWEQAESAFTQLGGDVVVKPLFGSEGRGIVRVSDPDLAHRVFKAIVRTQGILYLQEFIPHAGFDVRVLVLGDEVLGGIVRRHPTDFRTNVSRQGIAQPHPPTPLEQDLALKGARAVEACFAGVDLLYDPQGRCHVIEVNAVPGWRAFQRATGLHVAERLMIYLENETRERIRC